LSKFSKIKNRLKCNKPVREKKGKKTHKVKACKDGEDKLVRFGHSMPDGTSNKKRKKSYCARSAGIKGKEDKFSANYWSRKQWKCKN
jgi:hypothetical protein